MLILKIINIFAVALIVFSSGFLFGWLRGNEFGGTQTAKDMTELLKDWRSRNL